MLSFIDQQRAIREVFMKERVAKLTGMLYNSYAEDSPISGEHPYLSADSTASAQKDPSSSDSDTESPTGTLTPTYRPVPQSPGFSTLVGSAAESAADAIMRKTLPLRHLKHTNKKSFLGYTGNSSFSNYGSSHYGKVAAGSSDSSSTCDYDDGASSIEEEKEETCKQGQQGIQILNSIPVPYLQYTTALLTMCHYDETLLVYILCKARRDICCLVRRPLGMKALVLST
jgi:hypothetical protein